MQVEGAGGWAIPWFICGYCRSNAGLSKLRGRKFWGVCAIIIGWDLSTCLCGWAAGAGDRLPVAGAFELFDRAELGKHGVEFRSKVMTVQKRFGATHWIVESPLLTPTDHLWTLQRIYGTSFLMFTLAELMGIECRFASYDEVKREWAGRNATKEDMVATAVAVGVRLPETKEGGREDAADACGAWKHGVRKFAPQHITELDSLIWGSRGGLL